MFSHSQLLRIFSFTILSLLISACAPVVFAGGAGGGYYVGKHYDIHKKR